MIAALKRYYWKYVDYLWCRLRFGLTDPKHAHEFRHLDVISSSVAPKGPNNAYE